MREFPDKTLTLYVKSQDLRTALQLISEVADIRVILLDDISVRVEKMRLQGTVQEVLDKLADETGLVWWWDGSAVRAADRRKVVERSIKFPADPEFLIEAAVALGLPVKVVDYRYDRASGLLRVSGPAEVVGQIEDLASGLREKLGRAQVTRYGNTSQVPLSGH